jgi:hypothetical protein
VSRGGVCLHMQWQHEDIFRNGMAGRAMGSDPCGQSGRPL